MAHALPRRATDECHFELGSAMPDAQPTTTMLRITGPQKNAMGSPLLGAWKCDWLEDPLPAVTEGASVAAKLSGGRSNALTFYHDHLPCPHAPTLCPSSRPHHTPDPLHTVDTVYTAQVCIS